LLTFSAVPLPAKLTWQRRHQTATA
jgi:hypothetical protein